MRHLPLSRRTVFLSLVLVFIVLTIGFLESRKPIRTDPGAGSEIISKSVSLSRENKEKRYPRAKEISTPNGFVNTELAADGSPKPITLSELVGKKVILIDFWTYSCINCKRTTPYLNAWHEKYKDQGLVVIGLHTPEFEFEKDYKNVKAAIEKMGIKYPNVLDNDYSTWNAYKNNYWPRKYLIDIDGFIVYDHIGEGAYQETEKRIQELLTERKEALGEEGVVEGRLSEILSDVPSNAEIRTPEIYFGSSRNELLQNGRKGIAGVQQFVLPEDFTLDHVSLGGSWNIGKEYAESKGETVIVLRYRAKDVFFVASALSTSTIEVLRDGKKVGGSSGADVRNSQVNIKDSGLYHLIREPQGTNEHVLELRIKGPGFKAFTFTFG